MRIWRSLAFRRGSPSLSRCSSLISCAVMRMRLAKRNRTQPTSSTVMAAWQARTSTQRWIRSRVSRSRRVSGCHSTEAVTLGSASIRARQAAQASTPTLASAFNASIRLFGPNKRVSPRFGLSRDKSGVSALPCSRPPVCSRTEAPPASNTTPIIGPAARNSAHPASRSAASGVAFIAPIMRVRRSDKSCAKPGPAIASSSVAAPNPASTESSRDSGTSPSSRARCSRCSVAGLLRSPPSAPSAMARPER